MANTADVVTGNQVNVLRAYSQRVVSTLLNTCVVLAALGLMNSNKGNEVFGVGSPEAGMLISGAEVEPIRKKDIVECGQYYPEVQNYDQRDIATPAYRGNSATMSVSAGTATYTATVTSGVITGVSVGGTNTGFSGSPPTLVVVDGGYTGQGALLEASVSAGAVSVTILSGGYGYSSSGNITILENSGKSAGEKSMRPCFKWTEKETPGYVYKRDIDRFNALKEKSTDLFNGAVNDLTSREQLNMTAALLQYVNRYAIYGTPTDSTLDMWDQQFGLDAAISATNTYAGIDRTVVANYMWRGLVDSTAHNFTLEQLYSDSHLTKGIAYMGGKIDVFLVGPSLFDKYQREVQAYRITQDDGKILKLREMGYEGQIIKYGTSYVMSDNRIKPATVYGLNSKSWIFATKSGHNFKFEPCKDQTNIEGGKKAFYGLCGVQYMLICEAPALNVRYTNVS